MANDIRAKRTEKGSYRISAEEEKKKAQLPLCSYIYHCYYYEKSQTIGQLDKSRIINVNNMHNKKKMLLWKRKKEGRKIEYN